MEPIPVHYLLPASAGILFLIQSYYYLGLYRNLYLHSRKEKEAADTPPLSVILVAKDAAGALEANLPAILEQDYPDFEVIVIYDQSSEDKEADVLKRLSDRYPKLYYSFIPDSARYISHKKLGISMGIKASHHEWLVFTEPDCRPASNQWLRMMARNFTPDTEIVLGYSNYERAKGWFNRKITFDTLLQSMRFLGRAIDRNPYTGCGRNMAYRKSLYIRHKGFSTHLNLLRGEDDLFVNQTANGRNTRVEVCPESMVRIPAPHYRKNWKEDKLSHFKTSSYYQGSSRYLMGFETCTRLLFFLSVIACTVYGILTHQWWTVGIACLLGCIRLMLSVTVFHQTSAALGERKFYFTLLLFEWMQPLWSLRFKFLHRTRRKDEFLRK